MDALELLLELGTEELPARDLQALSSGLAQAMEQALDETGLAHGTMDAYASPRRLACRVHELAVLRPGRESLRRGPVVKDGGANGAAAEGFARACGVTPKQLELIEEKGQQRLACRMREPDQPTAELLPAIITAALKQLPVPRPMRWGIGQDSFARPVRWLVLLYGEAHIPLRLYGIDSGRETRGHRFHHPAPIALASPREYLALLEAPGRVLADPARRKQRIRSLLTDAADQAGGELGEYEELLDEVNALVEWPAAVTGRFPQRYLELPQEILLAVIRKQQRCFPLFNPGTQRPMPSFIAIANLDSRNPQTIAQGNERVIRPRLADAEFFLQRDQGRPLAKLRVELKDLQFHERLGSLHDKTQRLEQLCAWLADALDLPPETLIRAAALSKCDLLSELVGEFPELQGIVGGHLARHAGEPTETAAAIAEHYRPTHATDAIPGTPAGQALALADKLDTLAALFSVGAAPSADKDPYALRRAAQGCMRILIEGRLPLNLNSALKQLPDAPGLRDFMYERLRAWYEPKLYEAVNALGIDTPLDFHDRIQALKHFMTLPGATRLTQAGKRIRNILKQAATFPRQPAPELYTEQAERALSEHQDQLQVKPLLEQGNYVQALENLATLQAPVDQFFDDVLVLCEDTSTRENRLALLRQTHVLLNSVADISRL